MKAYTEVLSQLKTLKLKGLSDQLDALISNAETQNQSYLSFLKNLLNEELLYRAHRRYQRSLTAAHFPNMKTLESFEFNGVSGITKTQVSQLLDFTWIDNKQNLLLFGPPGIGKTHLSIAVGHEAIKKGYTVCFERITQLLQHLNQAEVQRSSSFRLKKIRKSHLLIIDEIGYSPISNREANLFFSLISDMYEQQSLIITSNKSFTNWAEMMGDTIMTTAMLDRLLHHARIFNLDGESYRLKHIKEETISV